jgi:hypothetical protein
MGRHRSGRARATRPGRRPCRGMAGGPGIEQNSSPASVATKLSETIRAGLPSADPTKPMKEQEIEGDIGVENLKTGDLAYLCPDTL